MEVSSPIEDTENRPNNGDFNPDQFNTSDRDIEQLRSVATSGTVDMSWEELQKALTSRLEKVLNHYMERNRDSKEDEFQEPNVEKFCLQESRTEIVNLITSFTEPPFTIQRICELLYSPFTYYDKISTFLRGLEKNLRVISSNDWTKGHVITSYNPVSDLKIESPPEAAEKTEPTETGEIAETSRQAEMSISTDEPTSKPILEEEKIEQNHREQPAEVVDQSINMTDEADIVQEQSNTSELVTITSEPDAPSEESIATELADSTGSAAMDESGSTNELAETNSMEQEDINNPLDTNEEPIETSEKAELAQPVGTID